MEVAREIEVIISNFLKSSDRTIQTELIAIKILMEILESLGYTFNKGNYETPDDFKGYLSTDCGKLYIQWDIYKGTIKYIKDEKTTNTIN
jgi:hypothetical protein